MVHDITCVLFNGNNQWSSQKLMGRSIINEIIKENTTIYGEIWESMQNLLIISSYLL